MRWGVSVSALCKALGMTRANYYKARHVRRVREVDEAHVEQLVQAERAVQPRLGGRKLHRLLGGRLAESGIHLGRDRFFAVLRRRGLLLERLPASAPRTTDSRHSLPVFHNLVKDLELTGPNQAWADDLTYIRTDEGFLYLDLLHDLWSRKIVGYHGGDTLETETALAALGMAQGGLGEGEHPVHHSDRGCQYCSHEYVEALGKAGMAVSMTEELHCYENAQAERLNGILKQEYGLGGTFKTKAEARRAIKEAVFLYNTRRPHAALGYMTPEARHRLPMAA
jgi:transposase InsO family protein